jgi:hypothetical protein
MTWPAIHTVTRGPGLITARICVRCRSFDRLPNVAELCGARPPDPPSGAEAGSGTVTTQAARWGIRRAATLAAHALLRACLADLIDAQINSHNAPQPVAQRQIRDREPGRAACLVLGAGCAASLASWAAGSPDRQCAAGVWQPLSGCPAAASRHARALREHCGRDGSPRRAAHRGRSRSAQHPQSADCMADGDHPGVRGLALTRLWARAGGQMRAGHSGALPCAGPARRDRQQRSRPGARSAGRRRIAFPRGAPLADLHAVRRARVSPGRRAFAAGVAGHTAAMPGAG